MLQGYQITSLSNPKIKAVNQLIKNAGIRKKENLFTVEGSRFINDLSLLRPGSIKFILLDSKFEKEHHVNNALLQSISKYNIEAYLVDSRIFNSISIQKTSSGSIAVIKKPDYSKTDITTSFRNAVLLDGLQIPSNTGAIIRSAAAFGIDIVFYTKGTSDPFHPDSIRAMAGNCFQVPIICFNKSMMLKMLESNVTFYSLDPKGNQILNDDLTYNDQNIFIFGSEGSGIRTEYLKNIQNIKTIRIAINPDIESLNVAVSAGILFNSIKSKDL